MTLIEVERCIRRWQQELPGWNAKIEYEVWDQGDGPEKLYTPVLHREKFLVFLATKQTWCAQFTTHGQCIEAKGRTPIKALNNLRVLLANIQREIQQSLKLENTYGKTN